MYNFLIENKTITPFQNRKIVLLQTFKDSISSLDSSYEIDLIFLYFQKPLTLFLTIITTNDIYYHLAIFSRQKLCIVKAINKPQDVEIKQHRFLLEYWLYNRVVGVSLSELHIQVIFIKFVHLSFCVSRSVCTFITSAIVIYGIHIFLLFAMLEDILVYCLSHCHLQTLCEKQLAYDH